MKNSIELKVTDESIFEEIEPLDAYSVAANLLKSPEKARDIIQDSWGAAWIARRQLRPDQNSAAWFRKIVKNRCIDRLRQRAPISLDLNFTVAESIVDDEPSVDPERRYLAKEEHQELSSLLLSIPPKYRTPLLLSMESIPYKEIAVALQLSEGAVKTRVFRARAMVKEILKQNSPD